MRNMITGGMSEQEARKMLLERGIFAFKCLAGSLPQKTDLIDNLPTFSVQLNGMGEYRYDRNGKKTPYRMARLTLKCDEPLCRYCADYLELFFQPNRAMWQIAFVPHWNYETCCLCGGVCDDDEIPF